MKWTKDLPDRPGWYWFRSERWALGDKRDPTRAGAPRVVQIFEVCGDSFYFGDGRLPAAIENWPGEWAGPVPEPEGGGG